MNQKPGVNDKRNYRRLYHGAGLCYFTVREAETDLHIGAHSMMEKEALSAVLEARRQVTRAIAACPAFLTSLTPIIMENAELVAANMIAASCVCGVGPMAAVAGAIAEFVGRALEQSDGKGNDVLVENGGDIYIRTRKPRVVAVYAGDSPFSDRLGIRVAAPNGCGLCTSAGRVGPSLSFGQADAVAIYADNAALADACATAAGNRVNGEDGVQAAIQFASNIPNIRGALVIQGEKLAVWGEMELVEL